jgi:hypothetical protein
MTPRSAQEWLALLPSVIGALGLVSLLIFWMVTSRVDPLLVTTFGGLLGAGQAAQALAALKTPPPPPGDAPANKKPLDLPGDQL